MSESYELDIPDFNSPGYDNIEGVETKNTKEVSLNNLSMTLRLLIKEKGAKVLYDPIYKGVESLKSIDAFQGLPPSIEFILRTIINGKHGSRFLTVKDLADEYFDFVDDFIYQTGFNESLVIAVIECITAALDGFDEIRDNITIVVPNQPMLRSISTDKLQDAPKTPTKKFYSTGKSINGKLWCIWFKVQENVGNTEFAVFRRRVENIACNLGFVHVKMENGIGFYAQSTFRRFLDIIKDKKTLDKIFKPKNY